MNMNEGVTQPIVVKRIKKGGGGHHGAAWKIAYADFVTAMMAFFLLMWLIGSTAKGDLEGIAEYFQTPLKVALQGGVGSGDASHVIKGGGQDLTRAAGQVKRGDIEAEKKSINLQALQAERERMEALRLNELRLQIRDMIEASPQLRPYQDQLLLDMTSEGLRIQIVDAQNRPMFDLSSAELKSYALDILRQIGAVLNGTDNRVSLSGHTDATPYASGEKGFSNWELSANRANASRRALISGGMDEAKVARVVGLGSTVMMNKADPLDPANRRISVIVLNQRTAEGLLRDAATIDAKADPSPASSAMPPSGAADR
jgi:chemotaxis protein MotB